LLQPQPVLLVLLTHFLQVVLLTRRLLLVLLTRRLLRGP
jgi:hypothetical protein